MLTLLLKATQVFECNLSQASQTYVGFLKRKGNSYKKSTIYELRSLTIHVRAKNKWTYGTNSHSFLLYFASEMCKALQDLPYYTWKQSKEFWIYTFSPPIWNFMNYIQWQVKHWVWINWWMISTVVNKFNEYKGTMVWCHLFPSLLIKF